MRNHCSDVPESLVDPRDQHMHGGGLSFARNHNARSRIGAQILDHRRDPFAGLFRKGNGRASFTR